MTPQIAPAVMIIVLLIATAVAGWFLFLSRQERPDLRFLGGFLLAHVPLFLYAVLVSINPFDARVLSVLPWMFASFFLYGPLLWFWSHRYTQKTVSRLQLYFHFLPFGITLSVLLLSNVVNPYEYTGFRIAVKAHLLGYLFLVLKSLWHQGIAFHALYSPQPRSGSSLPFWACTALFILVLFELSITLGWLVPENLAMTPLILLRALFVAFWSLVIVFAQNLNREQNTHRPQQETNPAELQRCSPEAADQLKRELDQKMQTEQWFLDPELSLNRLAAHMGVSPYLLSEVINATPDSSFYRYVNGLRIQYVRQTILQNPAQKWKVNDLCYQSGFNNRTSFTAAFKKETGCTPSQFLRNIDPTSPAKSVNLLAD